ncbi:GGDEF domain-containing protein [Marinimicrobium alkaliphilum]|uniref:GGDEF domain-containing protein n=1 Tax=Marinimicrobium alkaliphilum TaxID=2202654 RepID=UPI000DB95ABF|nr:sensor domain-containing diguanylate cyclase [Marinimicrobium alkaliphilum]
MVKKAPKPLSVASLLLVALAIFVVTTGLALSALVGFINWQARDLQQQTESALFASLQAEFQVTYREVVSLLDNHRPTFVALHREALALVGDDLDGLEVERLHAQLRDASDTPFDIYLIGPDLTIHQTTYLADLGLDFNHPTLVDGRMLIERAARTGDVLVAPPMLELLARNFRVYTYAPIGDSGYTLQLGFIPEDVNARLAALDQDLAERTLFDINLHFLMWDEWMLPLRGHLSEADDKNLALANQYEHNRQAARRMQRAYRQDAPYQISRRPTPRYYLPVMRLSSEDQLPVILMAEITLHTDAVAEARRALVFVVAMVMLLLIGLAVIANLVLRRSIAKPLRRLSAAMEAWAPFNLQGGGQRIAELQSLAVHYNTLLNSARSTIMGLDEELQTDGLTRLASRLRTENELAVEVRRCARVQTPFSIVFIDLDYFKQVNDTHGHLVGDDVLRKAANVLSQRCRHADTLGRWGGEEFLLLCRGASRDEAAVLAEVLRQAIRQTPMLHGESITASFGVADYRPDDTVESLVERADQALYRAKNEGRDRVAVAD